MLQVTNNTIYLTKGDTCYLNVDLTLDNGEAYEMVEGDVLTLSVRLLAKESSALLLETSSSTTELYISPEMTHEIKAGTYSYDIQLNRHDGDIFTVVGARPNQSVKLSNFILLPEVTIP